MVKINFLGAAGTVTGSGYLVTSENNRSVLVDFGLFQESGWVTEFNFEPLSFDVTKIDGVFLTHAHLDHCGRLPLLSKNGFKGQIFATSATKDIATISLVDAANIALEEKHNPILYTLDDVEKTIKQIIPIDYDKEFNVGNFSVNFHNAGHILGSASISLTENKTQKTIVFSGDLGNTPEDLIKPTEYFTKAQTVIMESTYGSGTHAKEDASAVLQQEINTVEKSRGVLLIPAFSIERSQEILHRIGLLKKENKILKTTPVFLDSPMAIEVMEVFKKYTNLYNKDVSKEDHPFDFENLFLTKSVEESKNILEVAGPKVIIAGSGMCSGGRILHHLKNYVSQSSTRLLFAGYQAANTLGRSIIEGAKQIEIYHQKIEVNATISKISSLSSHADQPKLIAWLKKIEGARKVFLTHGEDKQREDLMVQIKQKLGINNVILPKKGENYEIN